MQTFLELTQAQLALLIFVVALVGMAKGGLGGAFALFGVPILSIMMPSIQAAAILLPILIIMDIVSVWIWRGKWDLGVICSLLPMAIFGIILGWIFATHISNQGFRLILGVLSIGYALKEWFWKPAGLAKSLKIIAYICGFFSGFASFIAHAGGPPYQFYVLPLRLKPSVYTATSALFFAILNAIKLIPYAQIGQFSTTNLTMSFAMLPVAVIFTIFGARLVKKIDANTYYPIMNAIMLFVGIYLVYGAAKEFL